MLKNKDKENNLEFSQRRKKKKKKITYRQTKQTLQWPACQQLWEPEAKDIKCFKKKKKTEGEKSTYHSIPIKYIAQK